MDRAFRGLSDETIPLSLTISSCDDIESQIPAQGFRSAVKLWTTTPPRKTSSNNSSSMASGNHPVHGIETPSTDRLQASRKEEVISFLKQVISSERTLRHKVAELKNEQESVQRSNFRCEHILRQCVGQQAIELEAARREVQVERDKFKQERDHRLSEEGKRRRIESLLGNYRTRLASLRSLAFAAQRHLATAENLVLAAAADAEGAVKRNPAEARRDLARNIQVKKSRVDWEKAGTQRRRDLWLLRQQLWGRDLALKDEPPEVDGRSGGYTEDQILHKALSDVETVLDVVSRTFCISGGDMTAGGGDEPMKKTAATGFRSPSCQRVYKLLRKIEDGVISGPTHNRHRSNPTNPCIHEHDSPSHAAAETAESNAGRGGPPVKEDRRISVISAFTHATDVSPSLSTDAACCSCVLQSTGTQTMSPSPHRWTRASRTELVPVPPPSQIPPNRSLGIAAARQTLSSSKSSILSIRMYRPATGPPTRGLVRLRNDR